MDGRMTGLVNKWLNGWMGGLVDGRTDGLADRIDVLHVSGLIWFLLNNFTVLSKVH